LVALTVQEKERMIRNKEIGIGNTIVPITEKLHRGNVTKYETTFGRVISLKDIQTKHLQEMKNKGLLRHTLVD
jgi:hypothetical protein